MPLKSKEKKKGDENDEDDEAEASDDKAAAEELQKKIDGYLDLIGPMGFTWTIKFPSLINAFQGKSTYLQMGKKCPCSWSRSVLTSVLK